ncbi:MAG: photosystem P840 reaction-center cytochrome c-551 [Nitrospirae bacterium]|nr:photosystem P840 reaction-center cytochrome c-551 [Nitrospirota bacterium]
MISTLTLTWISLYAAEKTKVDAKAVFEKRCSQCHNLERAAAQKKTSKEWEKTVMRMKNVNGCPITDEEAKTIIDYLTTNYGK